MAKKEDSKKTAGWADSLKETLSSLVIDKIKERARELIEEFVHKAQDIFYQTQKSMMDNFSATVMALAGFLMIVMALAYFMIDYLKLQKYWSFLAAGAVLLIVSLILRKRIEKTKYYNFGGE